MTAPFMLLNEMEGEAREQHRTSGCVEREIRGHVVKCQLVSAMTRRAYGFSDDVGRATWYLNGKRASLATITQVLNRA